MLDGNQVLTHILEKKVPSTWMVLPVRRGRLLISEILTLIAIFSTITTIIGIPLFFLDLPIPARIKSLLIEGTAIFLIGSFSIALLILLIRFFMTQTDILILLPEGVIAGKVAINKLQPLIDFATIRDLEIGIPEVTEQNVISWKLKLVWMDSQEAKREWVIQDYYTMRPAEIVKHIIINHTKPNSHRSANQLEHENIDVSSIIKAILNQQTFPNWKVYYHTRKSILNTLQALAISVLILGYLNFIVFLVAGTNILVWSIVISLAMLSSLAFFGKRAFRLQTEVLIITSSFFLSIDKKTGRIYHKVAFKNISNFKLQYSSGAFIIYYTLQNSEKRRLIIPASFYDKPSKEIIQAFIESFALPHNNKT